MAFGMTRKTINLLLPWPSAWQLILFFNIYLVGARSDKLIQGVLNKDISFYKVTYPFAANSTFQTLLEPVKNSEGSVEALSMLKIMNIERETLMGQNLHNADSREAVGRLMTVLKEDFPADEIIGNKESHLFMNVEHLLKHLCSEVVLDKQSNQALL